MADNDTFTLDVDITQADIEQSIKNWQAGGGRLGRVPEELYRTRSCAFVLAASRAYHAMFPDRPDHIVTSSSGRAEVWESGRAYTERYLNVDGVPTYQANELAVADLDPEITTWIQRHDDTCIRMPGSKQQNVSPMRVSVTFTVQHQTNTTNT